VTIQCLIVSRIFLIHELSPLTDNPRRRTPRRSLPRGSSPRPRSLIVLLRAGCDVPFSVLYRARANDNGRQPIEVAEIVDGALALVGASITTATAPARRHPTASRRAGRLPGVLAAKTVSAVTIVWIWACVNRGTLSVKCPETSDLMTTLKRASPHSKNMPLKKLDE
jgi:hypothetical protein